MTTHRAPLLKSDPANDRVAIPASDYTFEQLAAIYNQARVDYIVPMPMNARRMEEYVHNYDIDLSVSVVAASSAGQESGVGMLGVRGDRTWITRLGVIPERRGHKIGQFITETLIEQAAQRGARQVQLEVIVGNEPAHRLFQKIGFQEVRELLIIRRPPGKTQPLVYFEGIQVTPLPEEDLPAYLQQRAPDAAWLEETPSLLNAGNLRGLAVALPSGENGWIIFQRTPFQLTHFVISPDASVEMMTALIFSVHSEYPMQDTKVENLPAGHPAWPVYQRMGYIEVFRRAEMLLTLDA